MSFAIVSAVRQTGMLERPDEMQVWTIPTRAALVFSFAILSLAGAEAADDLKLRPGISFSQDIDSGFPIVAEKMDDLTVESGRPTFIFFGASGDLNTNRQAKRIVDLYRKLPPKSVKFVIVDVDHPANDEVRSLIKAQYHGYIPSEVIFNKQGKSVWSHDGEVELGTVKSQLDKLL